MINIQKRATQKWCSKKVQDEKSSTCKKCNLMKKHINCPVKYGKSAQEQCTIVHKRKTGRPLTDLYTLVNRKE